MPFKKRHTPHIFALLLLYALTLGPVPARTARAQQQRERRVATPAPTPAPTPSPTPSRAVVPARTPAASATPPIVVPQQTPAAAPTPAPTQTPTPAPTLTPPAPQTVEELRARIREIIAQPQFASSHLAVKIASLDTGRVVFEENADKWLVPASNMKLYTVAAALDRLSPDFRFITSVYAPLRPDTAGTIRGDLIVYGRGDPTFATRFNPEGGGDYYRAINELAERIFAAGVRRVEGDLIGDESYFTGAPYAPGWQWDDLQWYYGAEVSALSVNDNAVDLTIRPGARVGAPCSVAVGPQTPLLTIVNRTTTAPPGTPRSLKVYRPLGENTVEVSGGLPLDDRGFSESLAVPRPALMFVTLLRTSLERRGVTLTGRTRTVDARAREAAPLQLSALVEIATRQSPPLSIIAAQTLKPSQNLYTELILRALGRAVGTDPKLTSEEAGVAAVKAFLNGAGLNADKTLMSDGSGLSRDDVVTADSTLQLLTYMSRHRYAAVYVAALPVAGVDGTLRNRMKGTPAAGNVRAKTGTLSSATSLSGYVTSAAGERFVFALMINHPPRDASPRAGFTEAVAVLLASFTGRT